MALAPRIERLDLMARLLRDRPGITANDLARALGISARSVFRDLDHLRDRGYPIESSRGRGGGLRLHGRWALGSVALAREEALCTLLALALSERLGFPMFAPEVGRARRKIADAFPSGERRRLAPLRERIFIGPAGSRAVRASYGEPHPPVMRRLQAAFVDQRVVTATYTREDGVRSTRVLEPHALVINWPAWYLIAHDRTRGDARTFRLDRFDAVELGDESFVPRPRDVARTLLEIPELAIDAV